MQDSLKHDSSAGVLHGRVSGPQASLRQNSSGRDGSFRNHMDIQRTTDASGDGMASAAAGVALGSSGGAQAGGFAAMSSRDLFVAPLRTHLSMAANVHNHQPPLADAAARDTAPAPPSFIKSDQHPLQTAQGAIPATIGAWHPQVCPAGPLLPPTALTSVAHHPSYQLLSQVAAAHRGARVPRAFLISHWPFICGGCGQRHTQ